MRSLSRHLRLVAGATAVAALVALCGSSCDSGSNEGADSSASPAAAEDITTLRLGYFPNFTHAPALVGTQEGYFKDELGKLDLTVTPTIFNAGPDAVTALFAGALDIAYIGPNPTVNAYVESGGD